MARSSLLFRASPIPYDGHYTWRAAISHITDGDTVWVERDTGCRNCDMIELRLTGYLWVGFNAAERFTDDGKKATALVHLLAPVGTVVRIETRPDPEKYGRWLSPVLIPCAPEDENVTVNGSSYIDLAARIVHDGFGRWQDYS